MSDILEVLNKGIELYNHYKWPREKVLEYSQSQFRKTLKSAYLNSNFYKSYYGSYGIRYNDLDSIPSNEIPVIDKKIVRDYFFDIAKDKIDQNTLDMALTEESLTPRYKNKYIVHTSGSTGTPCNFMYSKDAALTLASNFIRFSIGGNKVLNLKDIPLRCLHVSSVGSGYASMVMALSTFKGLHAKSVVLDASIPLYRWKEIINSFSPNYVSGYTSCISILADMQKKGEINIRPKKIVTGGEPVTADIEKEFRSLFDSDIINYYGCTESMLIGFGTSYFDKIYLLDDLNYVEIDEEKRLIITPLYNRAFPLIRYRIDDIMQGFNKGEHGPLPFTQIDKIAGRYEELMWFRRENGEKDFLHPLFIDDLNVDGIKKYQFEQLDDRSFLLRCTKLENNDRDLEEKIKIELNSFLDRKELNNIKYKIDFVDEISKDPRTGKVKMVINARN